MPAQTKLMPLRYNNYSADDGSHIIEDGIAADMISRRNSHLGNLFTAERASIYVTILYRMLLFKWEHELEPLYEDIYQAVLQSLDRYRGDLDQLTEWKLVSSRIEKQRLRGYRDNRKRKFRFRLSDEAASLLHWLEERLQDDLEERGSDARDLLGEVRGTLGELLRRYEVAEVRTILVELDIYVQVFLKQAFVLRREASCLVILDRLTVTALVSWFHLEGITSIRIAAILHAFSPLKLWRCDLASIKEHREKLLPLEKGQAAIAASILAETGDFPFRNELHFTLKHGWLEQESWKEGGYLHP